MQQISFIENAKFIQGNRVTAALYFNPIIRRKQIIILSRKFLIKQQKTMMFLQERNISKYIKL
jgi:hypothetical protein